MNRKQYLRDYYTRNKEAYRRRAKKHRDKVKAANEKWVTEYKQAKGKAA